MKVIIIEIEHSNWNKINKILKEEFRQIYKNPTRWPIHLFECLLIVKSKSRKKYPIFFLVSSKKTLWFCTLLQFGYIYVDTPHGFLYSELRLQFLSLFDHTTFLSTIDPDQCASVSHVHQKACVPLQCYLVISLCA